MSLYKVKVEGNHGYPNGDYNYEEVVDGNELYSTLEECFEVKFEEDEMDVIIKQTIENKGCDYYTTPLGGGITIKITDYV